MTTRRIVILAIALALILGGCWYLFKINSSYEKIPEKISQAKTTMFEEVAAVGSHVGIRTYNSNGMAVLAIPAGVPDNGTPGNPLRVSIQKWIEDAQKVALERGLTFETFKEVRLYSSKDGNDVISARVEFAFPRGASVLLEDAKLDREGLRILVAEWKLVLQTLGPLPAETPPPAPPSRHFFGLNPVSN